MVEPALEVTIAEDVLVVHQVEVKAYTTGQPVVLHQVGDAHHEEHIEAGVDKCGLDPAAERLVRGVEIGKIDLFVADVIEAREKKKNPWVRWYERLGSFFDKKFSGPNWREQQKEFWEEKLKTYY